jgi:YggT family protein
MIYQILSFLLDTATSILAGACLLRLLMQLQRMSFANQVGRLVFVVSDWIVLPLRKLVPASGRFDTSSLLAAYLLVLAKFLALWGLLGGVTPLAFLPVIALFGLAQLVITLLTALLIVYAVLSWLQPMSPMMPIVERMVGPMLLPIRRHLPAIAGFDFSPLVLLLLLQVAGMLLGGVQGEVLRSLL